MVLEGDTSNIQRCHRKELQERGAYNIGQEKGQREVLLELGLGLKLRK